MPSDQYWPSKVNKNKIWECCDAGKQESVLLKLKTIHLSWIFKYPNGKGHPESSNECFKSAGNSEHSDKDCGPFGGNCFSPFQKLIWHNSTNETLSSGDAPCVCLPFALKLLDIALEAYRELWKWAKRLFTSKIRGTILRAGPCIYFEVVW